MLRSHQLTHWGRVTHICVSKLTIIDSDNGLSPGRHQAIIWTNAGILLIRRLETNFNEMLIEILPFSFMKMRLKVSSAKWRLFCLGLNLLNQSWLITEWSLRKKFKWNSNRNTSISIYGKKFEMSSAKCQSFVLDKCVKLNQYKIMGLQGLIIDRLMKVLLDRVESKEVDVTSEVARTILSPIHLIKCSSTICRFMLNHLVSPSPIIAFWSDLLIPEATHPVYKTNCVVRVYFSRNHCGKSR